MNSDRVFPLNGNILLVDDTPNNLRLLSDLLSHQGYKVRSVTNGQTALKACQAKPPDLILLDINMPQMNGYEVCEKLKANEQTREIPVIFLSALDEAIDKVKAFTVGGIDYISKPFQVEEVLVRVKNQLALREAQVKVLELNAELENRVKERTSQLERTNQELNEEILERKRIQSQLLDMALHDPLTGLPNRAVFMERLENALSRTKQEADYQFAVLFLDCDRFKVVNDSLGHLVGDELLIAFAKRVQKALARRLEPCLSIVNTLTRLGGDEFAIIVEQINDACTATVVADRILQELMHPFQLSRHEVFMSASIGIALGNNNYEQPEYLLRDADTAMYHAKTCGKARYHVFDPAMHQEAIQLLQLETDLRKAINQQEFQVYYQPIVKLNTGKLAGFEALVRWNHPHRGFISPLDFIPIAEETGLITQIDTWVMREACQQLKIWQQQKLTQEPLTISVNLSGRQFSQSNLIEQIDEIFQKTQLSPQSLKLEITESVLINNSQSAMAIIQELKKRQIQLSLDDFGTGYSSLSYLHCFPINTLKIDKSFVNRMESSQENIGLVPAIMRMAHTMGINVIAEGIETSGQLAQLRALNCDFGQGYLFSKPVESKLASELIKADPQW
ncbi:EAL domain-containing protein [Coleofasciculus sp. FACHB-712]|uniref:two-component system response regulator n=1 Tax=Cyanophyceae TaxID=3028117 RepID=UPI001686B153|nr:MULTISPECIES: GGDEF domain-containing response regulator [unclassified Coleofasciculus]MBD1943015.1 EAL domain-containing protein [Coleofasciculus sp. FACHB-712]MBD2541019.1 EAL domain-containing protein [Coleofasciculus sp. FACHB-SPT36]